MHRKSLVFLTVLFLAVAMAGQASAALSSLSRSGTVVFPLEGSQEVSETPVETDASGECTGTLNPLRTAFDISCNHSAGDVMAAHIHSGPAGANGPIVFYLEATTSFSFTVTEETLQQQQDDELPGLMAISFQEFLDALDEGGLYVNVHTPTYPAGEIRGQIPAPPVNSYFAQFGAGSDGLGTSLSSDIVLLNSAHTGAPVTGEITFYNAEGVVIPPSELIGTGMTTPTGASQSLAFELGPLEDLTIRADRTDSIIQGSAVVSSSDPLGGVLRFDISGVGIAGVPQSGVMHWGLAPARRTPSGLSTAIAVVNPGEETIEVNLSLRQGGVEVANGSTSMMLAPHARVSAFLEQLFEDADTSDFTGTVLISTDSGFSAIVVEFDAANGVFTTLPVVPLR